MGMRLSTLAAAAALVCAPATFFTSTQANANIIDINDVSQFGAPVVTYNIGPPGNILNAPLVLTPSSGNNTGTLGLIGQQFFSVNSSINGAPLLGTITGTDMVIPFSLTSPVSGVGSIIEGDGNTGQGNGGYHVTITGFQQDGSSVSYSKDLSSAIQTYIGLDNLSGPTGDFTGYAISVLNNDRTADFFLGDPNVLPGPRLSGAPIPNVGAGGSGLVIGAVALLMWHRRRRAEANSRISTQPTG